MEDKLKYFENLAKSLTWNSTLGLFGLDNPDEDVQEWEAENPKAAFISQVAPLAAGTAKGCGSIDTRGLVLTQQKQGGSITNNTSYDFPYLVCVSDDTVMVFSDVKAGETITIDGKSKKPLLSQQISYFDDVYSVLSQDNMNGNTYSYKHKDMAAALYLGLCQIRRKNDVSGTVVVEGVTADYGKTIESRCSEISFGCLYTIAGQEVSNASN